MRAAHSVRRLIGGNPARVISRRGWDSNPRSPKRGTTVFRDRAEPAAMPQRNWSLRPGGMQGGMNLVRGVCATHRRYAKVLLAWGKEHAVWSAPAGLRASSVAAQSTECWVSTNSALAKASIACQPMPAVRPVEDPRNRGCTVRVPGLGAPGADPPGEHVRLDACELGRLVDHRDPPPEPPLERCGHLVELAGTLVHGARKQAAPARASSSAQGSRAAAHSSLIGGSTGSGGGSAKK
jgi:hypothetical protein